jgi:dTDP-4-dehydrorhamnose 3,5-epimerase
VGGLRARRRDLAPVLCPVGFAHGFCVRSDVADVLYKCSADYDPSLERALAYDDPDLAIDWPALDLTSSERDARGPRLRDVEAELPFTY